MKHVSLTPFGRQPLTAAHLDAITLAEAPAPVACVCKWTLLRDLTVARTEFGLRDRDLAVLSALLSFHPEGELRDGAALVVHPSNARLSERAHGIAESTLRRHLAALIAAGVIARRDSPNGKRYAAHSADGRVAFGFDLRPLLVQAPRIGAAADTARAQALRLRRLREATVIALRDTAKLLTWATENAAAEPSLTLLEERRQTLCTTLRRKMTPEALRDLLHAATVLRKDAKRLIILDNTSEMSGNDRQIGRHLQSSNKNTDESESAQRQPKSSTPPCPSRWS